MVYKVSISAPAGAGKDFIAEGLVTLHGFERLAFADRVKLASSIITGLTIEELNAIKEGKTSPALDDKLARMGFAGVSYGEMKRLVRTLWQKIGTEIGRDSWHPDTWVNRLMERVDEIEHMPTDGTAPAAPKGIVITDTRFPNEFEALRNAGFLMVYINTPEEFMRIPPPADGHTPTNALVIPGPACTVLSPCPYHHPSERALDERVSNGDFDLTIYNDRSRTQEELTAIIMRILTADDAKISNT